MRRFLLWRRKDVTGVSGLGIVAQGVVFADGCTVVRWRGETVTTTVHNDLASVERVHCHAGATKLVWCDQSHHGPRACETTGGDGVTRPGVMHPVAYLHDGWSEPNGAEDGEGVALFVGQRVRLRRLHGEVSNEGEIVDLYADGGRLMVGLYGTDCAPCAYGVDEIEAIDKTRDDVLRRNGGKKPSYGWAPALTIGDAS